MKHNCKFHSQLRNVFNVYPFISKQEHNDHYIVARVQPRTSKGITDLLSLSLK